MINATKKFYKNKNLIQNNLVSKSQKIDLVASMLKNNLRTLKITRRYKTDINPKLDNLLTYNKIQKYIESLDYTDTLYFYAAGLLELTLFNNNRLERNEEIKEATRNARILKDLLSTKDSVHKLASNFYVIKSDLKNVVLKVYSDLYDEKSSANEDLLNLVLNDFVNNFETYFENTISPIDVFTNLVYLKETSVTSVEFTKGLETLNNKISNAGGILTGVKIEPDNIDKLISDLYEIIGEKEILTHAEILGDNKELVSLLDYRVNVSLTEEEQADELLNFSVSM